MQKWQKTSRRRLQNVFSVIFINNVVTTKYFPVEMMIYYYVFRLKEDIQSSVFVNIIVPQYITYGNVV